MRLTSLRPSIGNDERDGEEDRHHDGGDAQSSLLRANGDTIMFINTALVDSSLAITYNGNFDFTLNNKKKKKQVKIYSSLYFVHFGISFLLYHLCTTLFSKQMHPFKNPNFPHKNC